MYKTDANTNSAFNGTVSSRYLREKNLKTVVCNYKIFENKLRSQQFLKILNRLKSFEFVNITRLSLLSIIVREIIKPAQFNETMTTKLFKYYFQCLHKL